MTSEQQSLLRCTDCDFSTDSAVVMHAHLRSCEARVGTRSDEADDFAEIADEDTRREVRHIHARIDYVMRVMKSALTAQRSRIVMLEKHAAALEEQISKRRSK